MAPQGVTARHADQVDEIVEAARRAHAIPGAAIAVSGPGMDRLERAYGYARLEPPIPTSVRTAFGIGSISKQFTAAAVFRLAEGNALSLHDDALALLGGKAGPPATVQQLLSHTSGIGPRADARLLTEDGPFASPEGVLECVREEGVQAGGQSWRYSNAGYILLGLLIERITGRTYPEFIRTELLKSLGLANTYVGRPPTHEGLAQGYVSSPVGIGTVDGPTLTSAFASGAVYATAANLLDWTIGLHTGNVLSAVAYQEMIEPAKLENGSAADYGCGVFVASFHGRRELSHDGHSGGFSCQAAHYPEAGLSVVVLTNGVSHHAERIEKDISALLLGIARQDADRPSTMPLPLEPYVGSYRHGSIGIPVWIEGEQLRLRAPSGRVIYLTQRDCHVFTDAADPSVEFKFHLTDDYVGHFSVLRNAKLLAVVPRG
jgi:D-alanyl-D-alanine carboxypeptidase